MEGDRFVENVSVDDAGCLYKVQRVQSTLARVVTLTAKRDHITPALERLHWLPIRYRVPNKLDRLTYKIHLSGEPPHLRSQLVDFVSALESGGKRRH